MKNKIKRSLRSKFTLYLIIFVMVLLNITMGYFYYIFKTKLINEIGSSLVKIVKLSRTHFDNILLAQNILKFNHGDKNKKIYIRAKNILNKIQKESNCEALYIFNNNLQSMVDTRKEIEIGYKYPHLEIDLAELKFVFEGIPQYSKLFRSSKGKLILSAYAPIVIDDKQTGLYIGADAGTQLLIVIEKLIQNILLFEAGGMVIILILSYIFSYQILKPINLFVDAAERISAGDLEVRVDLKRNDELGFLSKTFDKMIENFQTSHSNLEFKHSEVKRQVETIKNLNEYIISSMNSGLIIIDKDGKIIQANEMAEKILNTEFILSEKLNYKELFTEFNELISNIDSVFITKNATYLKDCILNGDDHHKILDINISAIKDTESNFIGISLLINDVTKIKELENEIEEKKRLSTLGEMAAVVAHEIRNPLSGISGFVELLTRKLDNQDKAQSLISKIDREIQKLNSVTTNFLTLSGKRTLNIHTIKVNTLLNNVITLIQNKIDYKKININKNIDENLKISVDIDQMEMAILNIILNSVQALDNKGLISITTIKDKDNSICIIIEDNGPGIPKGNLKQIWQPFFSTKNSGTGLGLSITKKIVESHKGSLGITSSPEKGTVVSIKLPL